MESPRILFNNKKVNKKNDSIISTNVRNAPQKNQTPKKQRQTRSDKKHDIKINLKNKNSCLTNKNKNYRIDIESRE